MSLLLGIVLAAGVVLTASPLLWPRRAARMPRRSALSAPWRERLTQAGLARVSPATLAAVSLALGVAVAAAIHGVFSIAALSAAAGAAALALLPLTVSWRARAHRRATRVAWPDVVDHLVSTVRAGLALPDGVASLATSGPALTRRAFADFAASYRLTGNFGDCLDELKRDLADPVADRILETLRMSREVGGGELTTILRNLGAYLREEAALRSELEARQSWVRNAARLGVTAPWLVLLLLATRPEGPLPTEARRARSSSRAALPCRSSPTASCSGSAGFPRSGGGSRDRLGRGLRDRVGRRGVESRQPRAPDEPAPTRSAHRPLPRRRVEGGPCLAGAPSARAAARGGAARRPVPRARPVPARDVLGGGESTSRRLRQAGSRLDLAAFRSRQVLCGLAGSAVGVALGATITAPLAVRVVVVALGAAAGVVLPDRFLHRAARRRLARLDAELPVVLEFLTLCLSAGEGVLDGLRRVSRVGRGELAAEFAGVVAAVGTGLPLGETLAALGRDVDLPALTRCIDQLLGALDRGTPVAEVLRAQARDARDEAKRELLETAGRKEIGMLVPLVFLILPVTVAFAIFPGIIVLQLGL